MTYYRAGPFNFTISNNSANTNSITSVLGLNDGKKYTLYIDTITVSLHRVLPKSHSIPNPALGCAGAQLRQILHFCTEASETCQLLRTPSQTFLWPRSTPRTAKSHIISLAFLNLKSIRTVTALYRLPILRILHITIGRLPTWVMAQSDRLHSQ